MKTLKIVIATIFLAGITGLALAQQYPYELPKLPYAFNALEPAIDAATMEIHYTKHHATYVKNLNANLKGTEFEKWPLDELMLYASETNDAIRNNVGGFYNHSLFWNILSLSHPFDKQSAVGKAIIATWASADTLKKLLNKAGATRFGSGWAWLIVTPQRKLAVCSSPNQDNPIMDVSKERGIPILAIDVWEHAYYLKYQNRRADYLDAVIGAINWDAVDKNYTAALESPLFKTLQLETWTTLNDFHKIMAETYHPSEKGDLKPIRQRSAEMVEKAQSLLNQPVPDSFNNNDVKRAIADLLVGTKELDGMIQKNSDDKTVTAKLSELHDTFHKIQGICRETK